MMAAFCALVSAQRSMAALIIGSSDAALFAAAAVNATPPSAPPPPPHRASEFAQLFCERASLTPCILAVALPALPSALLLLIQLLRALRKLCRKLNKLCSAPATRTAGLESGPPLKRWRDLNLWYASLICSVLLAAGALASILLGELLPPRQIPLAWLVAPLLEGLAGLVCAISIGASRAKNSRFGERLLVGGYAALQTIATIAALMALQPPGKASNAWLATTLWRVSMCCMLTLTSLWPNRLHEEKLHSSEDFLQPPPGSPSLQSPMARALLQQPDNASSGARSQRDVWAEWLTYSSAQIAGDLTGGGNGQSTSASINSGADGGASSSARPTHASDEVWYGRPQTTNLTHVPVGVGGAGEQRLTAGSSGYNRHTAPCASPRGGSAPGTPPSSAFNNAAALGGAAGGARPPSGLSYTTNPRPGTADGSPGGSGKARSEDQGGCRRTGGLLGTSAEARWSENLVTVEILGHMWVPDIDSNGVPGTGMHLEFMLKTVGDEALGARMVQRRFKDFDKLHTALTPYARRANVQLPALPTSLTFGRNLTEVSAVFSLCAVSHNVCVLTPLVVPFFAGLCQRAAGLAAAMDLDCCRPPSLVVRPIAPIPRPCRLEAAFKRRDALPPFRRE